MNKKIVIIVVAVIGLTVLIMLKDNKFAEVQSQANQNANKLEETKKIKADKVEVFLFHATQRCITCVTIGKFAGETVAEFFQPELRDGKIEFREINIDLPENKELAQKFQAGGSSLFINVIYGGQDHIGEDTTVWRLTANEIKFKSYLKNKLNNFFGK